MHSEMVLLVHETGSFASPRLAVAGLAVDSEMVLLVYTKQGHLAVSAHNALILRN